MNDPVGLVYSNGEYHLFYQYNPRGMGWGNMSWGHAVSPDAVHWTELKTAFEAEVDKLGTTTQMFFSGSAVMDVGNASGLGTATRPAIIAVYTSYYPVAQALANGQFVRAETQAQSLAFSNDQGRSWTQFSGNPVIVSPPIPYQDQYRDFRDPKIFWYDAERKWVMVVALAARRKILFYSSADLKSWQYRGEFGPANSTVGVWECPDLFELPVDGDPQRKRWILVVNVNPGATAGGSGSQYFVGQFTGSSFVADSLYSATQPDGKVFEDFESGNYASLGWSATGTFSETSPTNGTLRGQNSVSGFHGSRLVNTFVNGDSGTGRLVSPSFTVGTKFINLLVGGGRHPRGSGETTVNLVVAGAVVRSETGEDSEVLSWKSWDVTGYMGQQARIEIIDANTGPWGHILVDDIVFSDQRNEIANWIDYGPDYYASATWNDAPEGRRIGLGWMSNWTYASSVPTTPWRNSQTFAREFQLRSIDGRVRLVQAPIAALTRLRRGSPQEISNTILGTGFTTLSTFGNSPMEIEATFSVGTASDFGLQVHKSAGGDATTIGYDPVGEIVYVDRATSGSASFSPSFPGRFTASLPARLGHVKLHVFVDSSSVVVFGNGGEVVLTVQDFPEPGSSGVALFSRGGTALIDSLSQWALGSIWSP